MARVGEKSKETTWFLCLSPVCSGAPHWFRALHAHRWCLINTYHGHKMASEAVSTLPSHHASQWKMEMLLKVRSFMKQLLAILGAAWVRRWGLKPPPGEEVGLRKKKLRR